MRHTSILIAAALLASVSACSTEESRDDKRATLPQAEDLARKSAGDGTGAGTGAAGGTGAGAEAGAGTGAGTEAGEDGGDPLPSKTPQDFFAQDVKPVLDRDCSSCHAPPRVPVSGVRGPYPIFDYETLKPKLVSGTSATANDLYRKLRNRIDHGGGDRCAKDLTATPACRAVYTWWRLEFPDGDPGPEETPEAPVASDGGSDDGGTDGAPATGVNGAIETVSAQGVVNGWAANDDDLTAAVTVTLVVGGPIGTGTSLTPLKADRANMYDGGRTGSHAFTLTLPTSVRDGKQHELRLYADDGGTPKQLGATKTFVAFTPKAKAFFVANVKPKLQCGGCHAGADVNASDDDAYTTNYGRLIGPAPVTGGGSETNNTLHIKASGGAGHGGGNRCGGGNDLCAAVRAWWQMEFGG